jgi:hypothetical protein
MPKKKQNNGEIADAVMQALNISDAALQGTIGFERFRRFAQGSVAALKNATKMSKGYAGKAGPIGLAIEAANAAWLASDPDKRARTEADYEANAKKPAVERAIVAALSPSDMLYATGKAVYDTGKTNESIQRNEMDAYNNELLRKIAAHEKQLELERKKQLEKSQSTAKSIMSVSNIKK